MEEVLEKFENVGVNKSGNEPKSNFQGLYKNCGKFGNQEERRKDILELQKNNRYDKVDKFRGILDLVKAVEETKALGKASYSPKMFVSGFTKSGATYNDLLMLSEWMIEKPVDFHENWFVVPCPKGRRFLVVANQGITKTFSKYGQFRFRNYTALPGGNPFDSNGKNRCCVLDCIYDDLKKTMYILDLLAWNNLPMTDGETDFRNYWLQIHVPEIPELKEFSKKNQLIFTLLPKVPCDRESFNEFMMKCPHFENHHPTLDGLLFYHKRGRYFPGQTPIVGWLYPFMVPEVLGSDITVSNAYLLDRPADYVNQATFIEKFESKIEYNTKKQEKKKSLVWAMETAEALAARDRYVATQASSASNQDDVDDVDRNTSVSPQQMESVDESSEQN